MQENEPVLFVLSVCDGEIILEKGEILSEKRQKVSRWRTAHAASKPDQLACALCLPWCAGLLRKPKRLDSVPNEKRREAQQKDIPS